MRLGELYPEHQTEFRRELGRLGFAAAGPAADTYDGAVEVAWDDPCDGQSRQTIHRLRVVLPAAFPFAKPSVFPTDSDPPIRDARHQAPAADGGALCLFAEDARGWEPWMTASDLVARIRTWFAHHHRDDWPPEDRPPDLHLYFPQRQGPRPLMVVGGNWALPGDERSGSFGIWEDRSPRALAGAPEMGVGRASGPSTDRLAGVLGIGRRPRSGTGLWYLLRREPQPRTRLGPMLREIDAAAEQPTGWALERVRWLVGHRVRKGPFRLVLALGYPGASDATDWLFLRCDLPAGRIVGRHWAERAEGIVVESYETAPADPGALMRRTAHVAAGLTGRTVLALGAGAIGSSVAVLLAKAGVPSFHLSDAELLRPGNAVRHAAGLRYVGLPKVAAVTAEILQHAPDATVRASAALWDPDQLRAALGEADVAVDATANPAFSLLVNEMAVQARKPVVYTATYRRAAVGRVRLVRPGVDACLLCYEGGDASHAWQPDYPRIPHGPEGEFVEGGCGTPTVEASAVDIESTANVAARTALRLLQERAGAENDALVVNEVLEGAEGVLRETGVHWQAKPPIAECPACGRLL